MSFLFYNCCVVPRFSQGEPGYPHRGLRRPVHSFLLLRFTRYDGLRGTTHSWDLWEGYHESRGCSRDTYPESYITKYTRTRRHRLAINLHFNRVFSRNVLRSPLCDAVWRGINRSNDYRKHVSTGTGSFFRFALEIGHVTPGYPGTTHPVAFRACGSLGFH